MKKLIGSIGGLIGGAVNNKRITRALCLMAGVIGALPFFVEELFIFTFISIFIIALVVIKWRERYKGVYSPFFWYFLGLYGLNYLFLSELYPYERFGFSGGQAVFILIASCVGIPLLHASVCGGVMAIARFLPEDTPAVGISALWVLSEWVLTLGGMAFPWGGVAVSMTGLLPYLQTASLFGRLFITFITVSACFLFAKAIYDSKKLFAFIAASILIANTAAGGIMMAVPAEKGEEVKVAAIQGNIAAEEKWNSVNTNDIYSRYLGMTESAAKQGADLIIIPESAIPAVFRENGRIHKGFADIAEEYGVTVLSGIRYIDDEKNEYNSAIAILPDGSLSERYDKRHLVPFGEFIPLIDIIGTVLPFVAEFNESASAFKEGEKQVVIDTPSGKVTPLVCFDSIFPQFSADGARDGAEMIAVVTNDSWFGDSTGIYTHLRHSQLRAIETNRYVLRAANTGISAFIDDDGRITDESEALRAEIVFSKVYPIKNNTLYTYIGDVTVPICMCAVIIYICLCIRRKTTSEDASAYP